MDLIKKSCFLILAEKKEKKWGRKALYASVMEEFLMIVM
jgi:hypothetical protein